MCYITVSGRRAMVNKFWCQEIRRRWHQVGKQEPPHARLLTEPKCQSQVGTWYLLYRWSIFLLWTSFTICSVFEFGSYRPQQQYEKWLIYLTNWDILLGISQALLGGILVSQRWRLQKLADFDPCGIRLGSTERAYWFLYVVTTNLAIGVTVCYWLAVYNPEVNPVDPLNIMTHVCNSVLMLVDLFVTSVPFYLRNVWWCLPIALFYAIFTAIYYVAGGLDKNGYHYIYKVIDWKRPARTILVCTGAVTFIALLHCIVCVLANIRNRVYRRITERFGKPAVRAAEPSQPERRTETV